jgi:hypothetical protein
MTVRRRKLNLLAPAIALGLVLVLALGLPSAGGAKDYRSSRRSSLTVPSVVRLGLLTAYGKLHRAGVRVTFGRTFSIDWSGECVPIVTDSEPRASSTVRRGANVVLSSSMPSCGVASPSVPAPRPQPSRVPSFIGEPLPAAIAWVKRHHLTWAGTIPPLQDGGAASLYGNYTITGQNPHQGAMLALGIAHGTGWQPTPLRLTVRAHSA